MRKVNNLVWALLLVAVPLLGYGQGLDTGTAEVRSDRLEVNHGEKKARFEGNVRAKWGDLILTCQQMDVAYDDEGAIVSLRAQGKVRVNQGNALATSRTARLDWDRGF